jgi:hypothetical protein
MTKLLERYSSAVNSTNLAVDPLTKWSDTDVLGAAGYAAKFEPLGVELARFLSTGKAEGVIAEMQEMVFRRARTLSVKLSQVQAGDLAKAVLGWYRHGTCQPCGGIGHQLVPGTPVQGDECPHCRGTGRLLFDRLFDRGLCPDCGGAGVEVAEETAWVCSTCDGHGAVYLSESRAKEQLELARWLSGEVDRSQSAAGRTAMTMLAPKLEL